MPPMVIGRAIGKRLTGSELITEGTLTARNGTEESMVQAGVTYKRIEVVNMPVNHERNAKKLFKQFGQRGLDAYRDRVADVVEKSRQRAEAAEAAKIAETKAQPETV